MPSRHLLLLVPAAFTLTAADPPPAENSPPQTAEAPSCPLTHPGSPLYAQMFSNDDYPRSALRKHQQGRVCYRITVGTNGRITECRINQSSGYPVLDAITCKIAQERMHFIPAHDEAGNPTVDYYDLAVEWRLPSG
jgi:protein TonB